jgi:hypothetical protein
LKQYEKLELIKADIDRELVTVKNRHSRTEKKLDLIEKKYAALEEEQNKKDQVHQQLQF